MERVQQRCSSVQNVHYSDISRFDYSLFKQYQLSGVDICDSPRPLSRSLFHSAYVAVLTGFYQTVQILRVKNHMLESSIWDRIRHIFINLRVSQNCRIYPSERLYNNFFLVGYFAAFSICLPWVKLIVHESEGKFWLMRERNRICRRMCCRVFIQPFRY